MQRSRFDRAGASKILRTAGLRDPAATERMERAFADYRESEKEAARARYRGRKGLTDSVAHGLGHPPTSRAVTHDGVSVGIHPTYTIRETSLALGKSLNTIRGWVRSEKLPPPVFREEGTGYPLFTMGELQTFANILAGVRMSYLVSGIRAVERMRTAAEQVRRPIVEG